MSAVTAVLLHHFGGSAGSWSEVAAGLNGQVATLALDLPGFGDAAGVPGPYTVSGYADHVGFAIREHGLAQYLLVGHSMGGKVALALASRTPPGLQGLLLLAPSPLTPEPMEEEQRRELIAGWGDREAALAVLQRIVGRALPDALVRRTIDDMVRASKSAWRAWLDSGSREDLSAAASKIAAPATILSGSLDAVLTHEVLQREVARRLADARLLTVPGAGHLLPIEAPKTVADAIVALARGVGVTTAGSHTDRHPALGGQFR